MSLIMGISEPKPAMATDIPVLVPWRTDHSDRERIWQLLREHYWSGLPYRIVEGSCDDGPFNRSQAINHAATSAGEWDLVIIADADSFVPVGQLTGAIRTAQATGSVVIAHSRWIDVHPDEVDQVLNEGWIAHRDGRAIWHYTVSSMLVVPRSAFDAVNGFDERFSGWGCEDQAFMRAVKVLHGEPQRIEGTVWHLAHDRPHEDTSRHQSELYRANRRQYHAYRAAVTPRRMLEVVKGNR